MFGNKLPISSLLPPRGTFSESICRLEGCLRLTLQQVWARAEPSPPPTTGYEPFERDNRLRALRERQQVTSPRERQQVTSPSRERYAYGCGRGRRPGGRRVEPSVCLPLSLARSKGEWSLLSLASLSRLSRSRSLSPPAQSSASSRECTSRTRAPSLRFTRNPQPSLPVSLSLARRARNLLSLSRSLSLALSPRLPNLRPARGQAGHGPQPFESNQSHIQNSLGVLGCVIKLRRSSTYASRLNAGAEGYLRRVLR